MSLASPSAADEGMWLFNDLPVKLLRERFGFEPDASWAQHVMRSCVRLSTGGSGSFVSPQGLVLTNHHVAAELLQKLSTAEKNYYRDGFFARSLEEEVRCPGVEVLVLWEIEDVSARVNAAVTEGMDPGAAEKARRAARTEIERESKERTGLHSEVVTLYRGGAYHLYRYRRYDDVRLVMAPETAVAFFGGDADNFEFPRHCLDAAFLRVYEEGRPAHPEHSLRWSPRAVREGELVLVAGHPGSTQRLNTFGHLRFLRDTLYPSHLATLYQREVALQQFSLRGAEARRIAQDDLFAVQNSRKAYRGILQGLLSPSILGKKARAEAELKARVAADPSLGASLEDWDGIASSLEVYREILPELAFLEWRRAFWSELYAHAQRIVRLAEESTKPDEERLREYTETARPRLEMQLFSEAPIYPELETAKLAESLTAFASAFGAEHGLVQLALAGRSPAERAHELVSRTRLRDVAERRRLAGGGLEAIAASEDPMIVLARSVDPYARAARRRYEDLVEGVQKPAYARISQASFRVTGTSTYPDATFSLRLAFGVVKGWEEEGREIPAFTTLDGAYRLHEEHGGQDPYHLPESWLRAASAADRKTPLNFVATPDIVGGNSGSPVIDREARVVGLIFDGNVHSLILDIAYTEVQARAVAVSAEAIVETLRKVYGMERLVRELGR